MTEFDVEAIRAQIRAMDYVRGTPEQVAQWREDDEDARHDLYIEDNPLTPNEAALFDMMMDEAVPPTLVTRIVAKLLDHPDADPALAITPADAAR